jgi:drug/metabolite transporter (DMT)-like permease
LDDDSGEANFVSAVEGRMSRRVLGLFLALGLLWGMPYFLIMIAVQELSPIAVAFGRTALGALILLPFAMRMQVFRPAFREWRWLILYTLVEISGPWLLIGYAETRLTSSTAGLMIATTPLIAAAVIAKLGHERLEGARLIGLITGFCGVAFLLGVDLGTADLPAAAMLILSAVGYAVGPIIAARKLSEVDPLGVVAASLIVAMLIYLPAVPFVWPSSVTLAAAASVLGLAIFCTAVPFVLLFALIAEVGPARSTVITYINPAVAIALGVAFLDEPLTVGILLGLPLIIIGSFLGTSVTPTAQRR